MKKIVTILVLVFAFTLTTQAQKKGGNKKVEKMLQKMTTDLNLTSAQQSKIKPLLVTQLADRNLIAKKRKEQKNSGAKPSKEERKKMKEERNAKETSMNSKMAAILDKAQLEKYNLQKEAMKGKRKKGHKKD